MASNYEKVTITQVKKIIKEKGVFMGFAVGNKVNQANFFGNWHLAVECQFYTTDGIENYKANMLAHMDKKLGDNIAWYVYL